MRRDYIKCLGLPSLLAICGMQAAAAQSQLAQSLDLPALPSACDGKPRNIVLYSATIIVMTSWASWGACLGLKRPTWTGGMARTCATPLSRPRSARRATRRFSRACFPTGIPRWTTPRPWGSGLINCGRAKGGLVLDRMIQNIDIAPTVLEMAGLQKPRHMGGASFAPILEGKDVPWRDRIFYEYYWEYDFPQTPTMHGVRTDRYKLIRYHGIWDTDEFFDLQNDPGEMNNLITAPEHQKTIRQLASELHNWLETTDGMAIPLKRAVRPRNDHRNKGAY